MWNAKIGLGVAALGVAGTLLLTASGYGGPAAGKDRDKGKDESNSSIAFVDLNAVSDEIKKTPSWQKMVQKATESRTKLSQELDDMIQRRHLTDAEVKELEGVEGWLRNG